MRGKESSSRAWPKFVLRLRPNSRSPLTEGAGLAEKNPADKIPPSEQTGHRRDESNGGGRHTRARGGVVETLIAHPVTTVAPRRGPEARGSARGTGASHGDAPWPERGKDSPRGSFLVSDVTGTRAGPIRPNAAAGGFDVCPDPRARARSHRPTGPSRARRRPQHLGATRGPVARLARRPTTRPGRVVVARSLPRVVGGGRLAQQLHRHLQRASTGAQVHHRRRVLPSTAVTLASTHGDHTVKLIDCATRPMPGDARGTQANALGRPVPPDEPQRAGVRLVGPRGGCGTRGRPSACFDSILASPSRAWRFIPKGTSCRWRRGISCTRGGTPRPCARTGRRASTATSVATPWTRTTREERGTGPRRRKPMDRIRGVRRRVPIAIAGHRRGCRRGCRPGCRGCRPGRARRAVHIAANQAEPARGALSPARRALFTQRGG